MKTVEVEAMEARPGFLGARHVVLAEPFDELPDLAVPPHPGGKARERRALGSSGSQLADPRVDLRRVRPVRLNRHDREPVALDELARDPRAHAVELRRAVRRFTEEDDARVAYALDKRAQLRG